MYSDSNDKGEGPMAVSDSYFSEDELKEIGFREVGRHVLLSRKASIYGAENMTIGDHVRIDDFCCLTGNIILGNYIHIAVYSALFAGAYGIEMDDFTTLSSRCAVYALTDDYSGEAMTNPMVPECFRGVSGGRVTLQRHVIVGSGCTILPAVTIEEGVAVGSMSLVNRPLEKWGVYAGIPCRRIKERKQTLLEKENQFIKSIDQGGYGNEIL